MNILAENMAFMSLFRAKPDCSVTCVTPREKIWNLCVCLLYVCEILSVPETSERLRG